MKLVFLLCSFAAVTYAQVGDSGIVGPDGNNIQFPHGFNKEDIVAFGPSGLVTKSGLAIQFTSGIANMDLSALRSKRSLPLIGPSGILWPDGRAQQFTQAEVDNHVLFGPSGIVNKDGKNTQFRFKRASPIVGASGIVYPNGKLVQFTHEQADNIVLAGPSGIVTKNGQNIQFRKKRQVTTNAGSMSHAGIHRADGSIQAFDHKFAHDIILMGPSGLITKDGPIQLTDDLRFARTKRSPGETIVGESGMILPSGQQIQFKTAGTRVILEGPSGIILSDGTVVQKKL